MIRLVLCVVSNPQRNSTRKEKKTKGRMKEMKELTSQTSISLEIYASEEKQSQILFLRIDAHD